MLLASNESAIPLQSIASLHIAISTQLRHGSPMASEREIPRPQIAGREGRPEGSARLRRAGRGLQACVVALGGTARARPPVLAASTADPAPEQRRAGPRRGCQGTTVAVAGPGRPGAGWGSGVIGPPSAGERTVPRQQRTESRPGHSAYAICAAPLYKDPLVQ